jgi:hypothetical protein
VPGFPPNLQRRASLFGRYLNKSTIGAKAEEGVNVMKRDVFMSGEKALAPGTFNVINHPASHPQQIEIKKGELFPVCPSCKQSIKYRLVEK